MRLYAAELHAAELYAAELLAAVGARRADGGENRVDDGEVHGVYLEDAVQRGGDPLQPG